jgi:diaminopimelate decarboxylase
MKALSNVAVLQLLKEMGAGLDTVSIQEVQLGLHAGYEPEKIFYTPNGVSLEEIEEVNAMGVQINIDNLYPRAIWHKTPKCTCLYSYQSACNGRW